MHRSPSRRPAKSEYKETSVAERHVQPFATQTCDPSPLALFSLLFSPQSAPCRLGDHVSQPSRCKNHDLRIVQSPARMPREILDKLELA